MKKLFVSIFIFSAVILSAQDSIVPRFDLSGIFDFQKESPYVNTDITTKVGLHVQHSPIAYFDAGFDLNVNQILTFFHPNKTLRTPAHLTVFNAALTFPNMNDSNIDFAIFYGQYDDLNSDSILQKTAKVKMSAPDFTNYYPGNIFMSKAWVEGIGVGVYGNLNNPSVYLGGYAYWNSLVGRDLAIDMIFRGGWSSTSGALNFFAQAKVPEDVKKTAISVGFSGVLQISNVYECYMVFNLVDLEMKKYKADIIPHVYLMIEPRFKLEKFNSSIALFMATPNTLPKSLVNSGLNDSQYGLNVKFAGGNLDIYQMEGGVHSMFTVDDSFGKTNIVISPFYTCQLGNYLLDVRVPVLPLLYRTPEQMVRFQIAFRTLR